MGRSDRRDVTQDFTNSEAAVSFSMSQTSMKKVLKGRLLSEGISNNMTAVLIMLRHL